MLGFLIWNIVLSVLLLCVLVAIGCMCHTLQKRKKDVKRYELFPVKDQLSEFLQVSCFLPAFPVEASQPSGCLNERYVEASSFC